MQAGTRSSALPSPYLGSSALVKTACFLPKRKWQMRKEKPDLQFSLCFSRHPKKRSLNTHPRQLSQVWYKATSGCPASGASEPGTRVFLWRKLFLKQKYWLAGVGRVCWVWFRYSCRDFPHQRASAREMVLQKQITVIPQGRKKSSKPRSLTSTTATKTYI